MDYMDEKMIKFYQSSDEFFKSKKNERVILLTTKSSDTYTAFKFEGNETLLFGRESAGVPENVHNLIKYRLKIPMMTNKRSLNIASSVAIVLSENLRQTNFTK
jgi:tRNA (cytidine/uridine-2'-O-)-methyltransferase